MNEESETKYLSPIEIIEYIDRILIECCDFEIKQRRKTSFFLCEKKDSNKLWLYGTTTEISGSYPNSFPFFEIPSPKNSSQQFYKLLSEKKYWSRDPNSCNLSEQHTGNLDSTTHGSELTTEAYERLLELRKRSDSKQAFVAMWFDESMNPAYEAIKEACANENLGYRAYRVDNDQHNENITNKIIAEIRRSKFLVADLTLNRGGVYWEAGFAYGLGKEVIYCMRKEDFNKEKPHFDVQQINFILWKDEADLKNKLIDRIGATVI